jgi:peptide-methionine (S)-S-oxide reductase
MKPLFPVIMKTSLLHPFNGAFRFASLAAGLAFTFLPGAMNAQTNSAAKTETATFGGGCFWCAEAVFQRIPGVKSVTSGFAGGTVPNPTYEEVCTGTTGHAEVIQLKFDPAIITYDKILEIFWEAHDPTTLNRQGEDIGTQYRSIILYANDAQERIAKDSKAKAGKKFTEPIVTEIVPLKAFYSAEAYHQNYFNTHKNGSYCAFVITPKLKKLIQAGVIPQEKP